MKLNKIQSAKSDLDKAIQLNPRSVKALNFRGDLYRQQNKLEQAVSDLSLALSLEPRNIDSAMVLGEIYEEMGKVEKAVELYTQGIEKGGIEDAIIYIKRGAALIRINKYKEAIPDYLKAVKLNPKMQQPYHGLILCYIKMEKFKKAWKYVEMARVRNIRLPSPMVRKLEKELAKSQD